MHIERLADAPLPGPEGLVAIPFATGTEGNVRLIRIAPGSKLPAHRHGVSDLFLYAVEGEGVLTTNDGEQPFVAGELACYTGEEELRLRNAGETTLTLLAFLAPIFPPANN